MVELLPGVSETLGSIPTFQKRKKKWHNWGMRVLRLIGKTGNTRGYVMSTRSGLGMYLDGTALAWCEAWDFPPQPCQIDT